MKIILLIIIGLSVLNADFTKTGDIVSDSVTHLEWQNDAIGTTTTWQGAINRCEYLSLGGYHDWRLPNINELKSIVDRSKKRPAIVSEFTSSTSTGDYWSSTTYDGNQYNAWVVNFYYHGYVEDEEKSINYYVRCVRSGQ